MSNDTIATFDRRASEWTGIRERGARRLSRFAEPRAVATVLA